MIKAPQAAGMVLCQGTQVDATTGAKSLVGIFNTLTFEHWPTRSIGFTVYTPLFGGSGDGTLELLISHFETEVLVYRYRRRYGLGPEAVHLEIVVRTCVFPVPGRYCLRLRFNAEVVSMRYLDLLGWRHHP